MAVQVNKRPTAVITRDDWFGHYRTGTSLPFGDAGEWTDWDYALIDAYQIIEDYTDEYGILAWQRDDEAVVIDAKKKIHPFKQAVDQVTAGSEKRPYKPEPGEYFVPDIYSRRKDEQGKEVIQTYSEWIKAMSEVKEDRD